MVAQELLDLLACPETKQPVRLAEAAVLEQLNQRIEAGDLVNKGGQKVEAKLEAGLLREDGEILYPIVDDIPIMLIDEGIAVKGG